MNRRKRAMYAAVLLPMLLMLAGCPKGLQGLATASDAVAHALKNAQDGVNQGVQAGAVSPQEAADFNGYLAKASQAGLTLDSAIRNGETAASISAKANVFLDAFNQLQNQGLAGIKNPATRLAIGTAINGAEAAISIIQAQTGAK